MLVKKVCGRLNVHAVLPCILYRCLLWGILAAARLVSLKGVLLTTGTWIENLGLFTACRFIFPDYFDENIRTTVGVDFLQKKISTSKCPVKIQLWDIAGQERFGAISRVYYKVGVCTATCLMEILHIPLNRMLWVLYCSLTCRRRGN
jgi:hypothetical protein